MTVSGGWTDLKNQSSEITVSDILERKVLRGSESLIRELLVEANRNCFKGKMGSRGVGRFTRLVGEPGARVRWTEQGFKRKREPLQGRSDKGLTQAAGRGEQADTDLGISFVFLPCGAPPPTPMVARNTSTPSRAEGVVILYHPALP